MKHLINKQVIELNLNSKKDAIQWQTRMSQFYWNDILPALEQVFDELSLEGEIISVEKLEIDLGIIQPNEMEKGSLDVRFLEAIKQQLREQLEKLKSSDKMIRPIEEKNKLNQQGQSTLVTRQTTALGISRQWFFYMKNGYLPWNAIQVNKQWFDKVLEAFATDFTGITELRLLIQQSAVLRKRIVLQHAETFLVKLLEVLTARNQSAVIQQIKQLLEIYQQSSVPEIASIPLTEIKTLLWEKALLIAALNQETISVDQLSAALVDPDKKADQEIDSTAAQEPPESLFIENAGLVLLHPFISMFFQRLGLVKDGKFVGIYERAKAMYLLHFLVTGNTVAEEYELVLQKMLCQWPTGEPVNKAVEILPEELEEAEDLLEAAIEKWAVLKNTNADGLREGFLQRKGKLFRKNDKTYLAVGTSAIDVLLDHLPWNIGMVKLPWMQEILWVEWR